MPQESSNGKRPLPVIPTSDGRYYRARTILNLLSVGLQGTAVLLQLVILAKLFGLI